MELDYNIVYCLFAIQIKFYPRGDESNASNKLTADRHAVFTSLRPKTDYGFQVRAKTSHGWGEYSPTIFKTTGQLQPGSGKNTQQQVQRKNGIKDDTGKIIIDLLLTVCNRKRYGYRRIIFKEFKNPTMAFVIKMARFTFFVFLISAYIGDEDNMEVRIIAGATVAVVVVLVVVIIMTVLFLRRYVFCFYCGVALLMKNFNEIIIAFYDFTLFV